MALSLLACGEDGQARAIPGPGATLQGSFEVTNALDVETLRGFDSITGDLTIRAPGMATVELPELLSVGGDLVVHHNPTLLALRFAALETVGGAVTIEASEVLDRIDLPALSAVGAHIEVESNSALTTFSLDGLRSLVVRHQQQPPLTVGQIAGARAKVHFLADLGAQRVLEQIAATG